MGYNTSVICWGELLFDNVILFVLLKVGRKWVYLKPINTRTRLDFAPISTFLIQVLFINM